MASKYNSASFDMTFDNSTAFDVAFNDMPTFNTNMQELNIMHSDDHRKLLYRDAPNQHPIVAITGLQDILDTKQDTLSAGLGIVIENNCISLDNLILDCGTSTISI